MITIYHVANTPEQDTPSGRSSLPPAGEAFWLWREQRRYEFAAEKLREAGHPAYADLYDRFAEQARLEALALAASDQRIAKLDATLARGRAAE